MQSPAAQIASDAYHDPAKTAHDIMYRQGWEAACETIESRILSGKPLPTAYDYTQGDDEGDETYKLRLVGRASQLEQKLAPERQAKLNVTGSTPRTDAVKELVRRENYETVQMVPADFARQLERELAETRAKYERLQGDFRDRCASSAIGQPLLKEARDMLIKLHGCYPLPHGNPELRNLLERLDAQPQFKQVTNGIVSKDGEMWDSESCICDDASVLQAECDCANEDHPEREYTVKPLFAAVDRSKANG